MTTQSPSQEKYPNVRVYLHATDELVPFPLDMLVFSGGEPHVNIPPDSKVRTWDFTVRLYGGRAEDVMLACFAVDALKAAGANAVVLFAPYMPGARQDRGTPLTSLYFANMMRLSKADAFVFLDPHSDKAVEMWDDDPRMNYLDTVDILPPSLFQFPVDLRVSVPNVSIIAPDAGARARAARVAERFDLPLLQAEKHRDPGSNFAVSSYQCEPLATEYGIVIDDICDGGGTFIALAQSLGVKPTRLRLWTSHGIYSKGTDELYRSYDVVTSTDSFLRTRPHSSEVALLPHLIKLYTKKGIL